MQETDDFLGLSAALEQAHGVAVTLKPADVSVLRDAWLAAGRQGDPPLRQALGLVLGAATKAGGLP